MCSRIAAVANSRGSVQIIDNKGRPAQTEIYQSSGEQEEKLNARRKD